MAEQVLNLKLPLTWRGTVGMDRARSDLRRSAGGLFQLLTGARKDDVHRNRLFEASGSVTVVGIAVADLVNRHGDI